ncbi:MAG: FCD domain-containing protein [Rhizobiaceae bacterium]|nr:FCD domain-containing protein [Rhizobiaceae bacterium]|tara:strand:+ start:48933 stop:49622 length:690 start_codon:yes stop_codon:yes gene_type:complete
MISDGSDLLALRKNNTLSSLVAEKIETYIMDGRLSAGERINEAVLARELGVSRGPIREAARLLSSQGLVEFVANKGAFVRSIDRDELLEIYDLRAVLTGYACMRAAARHKDGTSILRDLHKQMSDAAENNDAAAYYTLNLQFHEHLINLAQSPRLKAMTDGLIKETHLFRQVSLQRHPDMAQSNIEHGEILAAIENGDEKRAQKLGESHVRSGKKRFEKAAVNLVSTED